MEPTPSNPVLVPVPGGVSPVVVGLLRGLGYATVAGAISAVIAVLGGVNAETLGKASWVVPVALAAARALEGWIDKRRGQANQTPAGSRPADALAYVPTPAPIEDMGLGVQLVEAPPPQLLYAAVAAAMPRAQKLTVQRVTDAVARVVLPADPHR